MRKMRTLIKLEQRLKMDEQRIFASANRMTSNITGMPGGGRGGDRIGDAAIRLADVRDAYREAFAKLEAMRAELEALLEDVEDPDVLAVMRYRYIKGKDLSDIWQELHMSERKMFYCLNRGETHIRNKCLH